jgi:hypothetical protein
MKTKLLTLMLLAGGTLLAETHVSIGIGIGRAYYPPPPPPVVAYRPPCPGPGYAWVDGYWAPGGAWVAGYWAPPAYRGSSWVAPRNNGRGYYEGDRGRPSDRDRDGHANDRDRGRGHADGPRR